MSPIDTIYQPGVWHGPTIKPSSFIWSVCDVLE